VHLLTRFEEIKKLFLVAKKHARKILCPASLYLQGLQGM